MFVANIYVLYSNRLIDGSLDKRERSSTQSMPLAMAMALALARCSFSCALFFKPKCFAEVLKLFIKLSRGVLYRMIMYVKRIKSPRESNTV